MQQIKVGQLYIDRRNMEIVEIVQMDISTIVSRVVQERTTPCIISLWTKGMVKSMTSRGFNITYTPLNKLTEALLRENQR